MRVGFIGTSVLASFLAFLPALPAQENAPHPRIITVQGTAEIKVAPDQAVLTLGVDTRNSDLSIAKATNDRRVRKLLELFKAAGVEAKNVQTSALTMGPEYSEEKIPKLLGYQVSQTITLTLTDLSKYEDLMTKALTAGVNRVDGVEFVVSDEKKYRDEARLQAVRAAKQKATAMATELSQSIGKPWEITEESGFETTRFTQNVRTRYQEASEWAGSTISAGQIMVRASLRVSFELQ